MEAATAFKVKRSVPIPVGRGKLKAFDKYPWRTMRVGDMFFVPIPEGREMGVHQSTICSAARIVRRMPELKNWEFTTRQIEQDGKRGIGVWRIK